MGYENSANPHGREQYEQEQAEPMETKTVKLMSPDGRELIAEVDVPYKSHVNPKPPHCQTLDATSPTLVIFEGKLYKSQGYPQQPVYVQQDIPIVSRPASYSAYTDLDTPVQPGFPAAFANGSDASFGIAVLHVDGWRIHAADKLPDGVALPESKPKQINEHAGQVLHSREHFCE